MARVLPVLLALLTSAPCTDAAASGLRKEFWDTNGPVNVAVVSGATLYVGGGFTHVGPVTGSAVQLDVSTGTVVTGFPELDGSVYTAVSDGTGGWYIGGNFTKVGGQFHVGLAHVLADNTVSSWSPHARTGNDGGIVYALAVSGSTVYVAGSFTSIGWYARNNIASVDGVTGDLTAWIPDANSYVRTLVLSDTTVYVGGAFTTIGGQTRNRIAALSTVTGSATAWNPNGGSDVSAMVLSDATLYVGGSFTSIGGANRSYIAELSPITGLARPWNPIANGPVTALAVSGSRVYAGGIFTSIGLHPRNRIAALDPGTGEATAWDPNASGGGSSAVTALAVSGTTIYAGGNFSTIGGEVRSNLAALDATTGHATGWDPYTNGRVELLVPLGLTVLAGGGFGTVGGLARNNLAAFDMTTGQATSWDPNADNVVYALLSSGTKVYAGGEFANIGGQPRNRIAALDVTSGLATNWNPDANAAVNAFAVSGPTLYVGGSFTSIGGQPRNRLAALDAMTGLAGAWDPDADAGVKAIAMSGSTIYAAGAFTSVGGQARTYVAALDSAGQATTWDAHAPVDNSYGLPRDVSALAVSGSTVFAGGRFAEMGGQARAAVAALDATTGLATDWNAWAYWYYPGLGNYPIVTSLAVSGSTVYLGGIFESVGGQRCRRLAALDAVSGNALSWDAIAGDSVSALVVSGATVYAGTAGRFGGLGSYSEYRYRLAALSSTASVTLDVPAPPDGPGALRTRAHPNPFGDVTTVQFALPEASDVTVRLFDVNGREVATIMDREHRTAGPQQVTLHAGRLPAGLYLYRVQTTHGQAEGKVVLMR
jgi:trimeric autotransporter adhesin